MNISSGCLVENNRNIGSPRVLFVGDLRMGQTGAHRLKAMEDLGCQVTGITTVTPGSTSLESKLWSRLLRKVMGPCDTAGVNSQILKGIQRDDFDILWLDKTLTVTECTLQAVRMHRPTCKIVGYSPDDMYARHNQSKQFLKHLPLYNIYFTTKTYNVTELESLGCHKVHFIGNAFDPHTHRPMPVNTEEREYYGGPVGFIGTWERERAESMLKLAQKGIKVRIWGNGWNKYRFRNRNITIEGKAIYGDEYALAICAFDINLCFLRKCNRDLQTTRSVEIPACGGFMLAERTGEHLALFEEGKEAEFFDSDDELLDKVRYYQAYPDERQRIAAAGCARCLRSGYSNHDRMLEMLGYIKKYV